MASYPGAVKTFTTRNAGDVIQPSHVNDLQDEVNAIESGLLNGTAPLTSSNATVNTLTVASSATFTTRPIAPPPEMALVYLASTRSASSATSTVVWNAQGILTNSSIHSTASNPERLTPQSTGVFRFTFQALCSENSSGFRQVSILDSSGLSIGAQTQPTNTVAGNGLYLQVTAYKRFDATGSYCVAMFSNVNGSTLSLSSGIGATWFAMEKL